MTNPHLVLIPTYNERGNVIPMCERILALPLKLDILFVDDNSPDGTGNILDHLEQKYENVFVIHRKGKLGVGSAHLDGIHWAYANGYTHVISMDCDATHSPEDISGLLFYADEHWNIDVVVGTRHVLKSSLDGWTAWRKFVTHMGHLLTQLLLEMPYDATGAFRVYWIERIPERTFDIVTRNDYAFFFESLTILTVNGFTIKDVAITLSPRACGSSKLKTTDLIHSLTFMLKLKYYLHFDREQLLLVE
jgi:dolichol-phosphate mannosyltransferase